MRTASILILIAAALEAQIAGFSWGSTQYNYSNQYNGSNGWANNGRYSSLDTTRTTWSLTGNVYMSGNDAFGPQNALLPTNGSAIILTTITDFTAPAAGVANTLVNSMDAFGDSSQDIYMNGTSMKSSGLLSQYNTGTAAEILYWSVYQQWSFSNPQFGNCVNIMRSDDQGLTWWKPPHVNHTTGVPTVPGNPTGDVPSVSSCMFPTDIKSLVFFQYCQGNFNCPVVDGNDTYVYALAESEFGQFMYVCRVLTGDLPKLTASLYSWYKGPVPSSAANFVNPANWSFTESDHVAVEPAGVAGNVDIIGPPIYLPALHRYVTVVGTTSTLLSVVLQGVTPAGPWSVLQTLPTSPPEGWHAPVLSSLKTSGSATTVNYLVTNGPGGLNTGNPALNTYGPMFHVAAFLPYLPTVTSGKSAARGSVVSR